MRKTTDKIRVPLREGDVVKIQGIPVTLASGTSVLTTRGDWDLILRLQAEDDQREMELAARRKYWRGVPEAVRIRCVNGCDPAEGQACSECPEEEESHA